MKRCRDCHRSEEEASFEKYPRKKLTRCDECFRLRQNESQKKYREANKEKIRIGAVEQRKNSREKRNAYNRENRTRFKYNLSKAEHELLLNQQEFKCAICGSKKKLCIDHDHNCCPANKSCGKCIRGLLCQKCNQGLGMFQDDIQILKHAQKYLEQRLKGVS
jgi:hypothetical protein